MMNDRSLTVLEYKKIIRMLTELCVSDSGKKLALAQCPESHPAQVRLLQKETEEAESIMTRRGGSPLLFFKDVRDSLKLSRIGATLSPKALLDVAGVLRASKALKDALRRQDEDNEASPGILETEAEGLLTQKDLLAEIEEAILSEEEIADRASSELYDIRRKKRSCNDRVRDKLNSMIHSASFQKYLQDPIVTVRSDRYVLPVRQEYRSMVPGIVHDQSASGATVYIEPTSVVEIGNELKALIAAEKAEIERILLKLSAEIAPHSEEIETNLDILSHQDFVFARAALARQMHAVAPKINDEGRIRIVKGRHPLIDPAQVVPLDIRLGDGFRALVITGPNTGGKTVTLKTTGLFCAMAQAGLFVPADYGTELPVYDEIFADIGDEQSIEQSLSTFSGHMKNIVGILQSVTPKSLVLFDELGAGTDPTEGAALAQAIIKTLLEKGVSLMATTHYSELKAFAMTTQQVENASVEFDVTTLRPTYHLLIGVPGKSNAFEISEKLGLPESIIAKAREMLSGDQVRFEDVLANAEYHRQLAEKERQLAEEAREEMMRLRNQADSERKKLETQRENIIKKARTEATRIVEGARHDADTLVDELRRMKKNGQLAEHEIQKVKKGLDEAADKARFTEEERAPGEPLVSVSPGDVVHVVSMDTDATVISEPDAKGMVQLKAGMMKMRARLSDLRSLTAGEKNARKEKEKKERRTGAAPTRIDVTTRQVRQEIDLRGLALDEAIPEVQKFLDDAMISSLGEVCIIHGNGTGVLRQGIAELLRRHPAVRDFRKGRYGEGETGVTIVTLK